MSISPWGFILLVAAMVVESLAQLLLKIGASGGCAALQPSFREEAVRCFGMTRTWPWISLGVGAYGLEILLYTLALQRLDLSVAFPIGSLCFVGVALLSKLVLGEAVGFRRWLGVGIILTGVSLLAT